MNKVIHESEVFKLTRKNVRDPNKRGKGHPHYIISSNWWYLSDEEEDQVRNIVDPQRNISGKNGNSWKFKDLTEARKKYMLLIMRWS